VKTIYRTHLELDPAKGEPTLEKLMGTIIHWARTRPKVTIPDATALKGDLPSTVVGERCEIETRRYQGSEGDAWGLRLTMPDQEPHVEWVTEATVTEKPDGSLWFACNLVVGSRGESLTPVFRKPNRPGIVSTILSEYQGKGVLPLTNRPLECRANDKDIAILMKLLESPDRRHPIVFISTDERGSILTNAEKLARQLAGLAFVICASGPLVADCLAERLPAVLSCFNAGVRLYWPQFTQSCNHLDHPLWTRPRIQKLNEQGHARLGEEILNRIASVASFLTPPNFVPVRRIIDWQRAHSIEQAKAENKQDELLALFEEDNRSLESTNAQLRAELGETARNAAKFRELAETYRLALQSGNASEIQETLESNIATVGDALEQASKEFEDRLVFCWNQHSDGVDSPFEDAHSVYLALKWLATGYYEARSGATPCDDFDVAARTAIPGWSYTSQQSKQTMNHRKLRSWYHARYQGADVALPEHLKCGSTKDARFCIRVGFSWDSVGQRVILGFLGQHQQTSAT
jgi:hypothetical protein